MNESNNLKGEKKPFVDVILPNYNKAKYLEDWYCYKLLLIGQ